MSRGRVVQQCQNSAERATRGTAEPLLLSNSKKSSANAVWPTPMLCGIHCGVQNAGENSQGIH